LQLGVLECQVYHNDLINTKSQVDFDLLRQLHMLVNTEEDQDMKIDDHSSNHKFLVEWNDINKTKSWVNF
jgi:hypothetical protein